MKRLLIALMLVSFFGMPAFAEEITGVGFDGSGWNGLKVLREIQSGKVELLVKTYFVRGIYEGLSFGQGAMQSLYYTETSYEHLVKALDQFYADYRNEKVFVGMALRVIAMELRGESPESIDEYLRRIRKAASEVERKRP